MKSFLIGLGIGLGLGVLFAPMSGEETRSNLSDRASELANSARESYEQGRERVRQGVEQVRSTAQSSMENFRGAADRAVNQARTGTEPSTSL
ncbi:MAG TPA: YtxH domain-containing protein [Candidatus Acidoferrales bacterium]|nr:YtxH domain-containing protein [Candidatus Acidoferrales bacterium]